MEQGKDFNTMAKARYAELEKQEAELKVKLEDIQKQKNPLKVYLQGAGLIEVKRRGRRRKKPRTGAITSRKLSVIRRGEIIKIPPF